MIVIQTSAEDVASTDVIKWLRRFGCSFLRLNDDCTIKNVRYVQNECIVELEGKLEIPLSSIDAYWYRRGSFQSETEIIRTSRPDLNNSYSAYYQEEIYALNDFFLYTLRENVVRINDLVSSRFVNKNTNLVEARKVGLNTPDFIVTNRKEDLVQFCEGHVSVVTKPIHASFMYGDEENWYPTYTEKVTQEMIDKSPEEFCPTLFQQEIEKRVEIRSFYLNGEIDSMAIFSQSNDQTKVDFRVYDHKRPARSVPFKLPKEVEIKIVQLMEKLNYESGSLDLVYTPEKEYVFLEINPIGQFGMVSFPCNYGIEKKIAQFLSQHGK